jgi:hypothetical protein
MKEEIRVIRLAAVVLILATLMSLVPVAAHGEGETDLLVNGNFEGGFQDDGVGIGWERFDNGGGADCGWYDDQWDPVVFDGEHSQLIEINSMFETPETVEGNRYSGIYQTVAVVPGADYELTVRGLVRSSEGDPEASTLGYRLAWGVDYDGNTDWRDIDNWNDLGWDDQPRESWDVTVHEAKTNVTAQGDQLTLFFRAHKKWPVVGEEGDYNLDGLSLVGPAPAVEAEEPAEEAAITGEEDLKEALPLSGMGILLPIGAGLIGLILIGLIEGRLIADWFRRRWTL